MGGIFRLGLLALVAGPLSCSMLLPLDGYSGGAERDLANSDAGQTDTGLAPDILLTDAGTSGADAEADAEAEADAGRCPRGVGPTMIEVTSLLGISFCIDSTEVTQNQYQQFLKTTGTATITQEPFCSFNTGFAPTSCGTYDPVTKGARPVDCVNWCQASAFCRWNGKRLCGKIGGGPLATSQVADPTKDQWSAACSANGSRAFPYGASYNPTACNTADREAGAAWSVGSQASCQGGETGLFDMSGNIGEWQDACDDGPANANCAYRGGRFIDGFSQYLRCDNGGVGAFEFGQRGLNGFAIGFRCCAD